ncbi:MAG: hypothetical protein ABIP03_00300 [Aquihabitans sp.]
MNTDSIQAAVDGPLDRVGQNAGRSRATSSDHQERTGDGSSHDAPAPRKRSDATELDRGAVAERCGERSNRGLLTGYLMEVSWSACCGEQGGYIAEVQGRAGYVKISGEQTFGRFSVESIASVESGGKVHLIVLKRHRDPDRYGI